MSRLPAAFDEVVDATGQPVSGGKRYVYAATTTTPVATYPTKAALAAESGANTNPLVADAGGQLGEMWVEDGLEIKIVDKDASDVTLRTIDNFTVPLDSSSSLITRVKQIASNPIDYGAVGDGANDESSQVQEAIDGATTNGVVDLLGLTFRCDSAITLRDGVTLRNGTLDFSNCTDDNFVIVHGTLGSENLLTSDVTFADGSVAVTSASGLAAGDLISIYDTQSYIDGIDRGELAEIESIASLVLSLQGAALDEYATASSGAVKKLTTVDDVRLDSLVLIGAEAISGTHNVVSLRNTRRTRIRSVTIQAIDNAGIRVAGSWDTTIESCAFQDGFAGVVVGDASQYTTVANCTFTGIETGTIIGSIAVLSAGAAQGVPRFVTVRGCSYTYGGSTTNPQIQVAVNAQHVLLDSCRISQFSSGAGDGIGANCVDLEIRGCEIYRDGTGTPEAISMAIKAPNRSGRGYMVRVLGNKIRTDGTGISYNGAAVTGGAGTIARLEVSGNTVDYTGSDNIVVAAGSDSTAPDITELVVSRNAIGGAITISSGHASTTITRCRLVENDCESISVSGTTKSITTLLISGGAVNGASTAKLVDIDNVAIPTIRGAWITGSGSHTHGIELTNVNSVFVSNCRVVCSAGASNRSLLVDEAGTIDVRASEFFGEGIEIDNTSAHFSRCIVSGCTIVATNSHGIEVDASESDTGSSNLQLSGNDIDDNGTSTNGINITGYVDVFGIYGNVIDHSDTGSPVISITGDASGEITEGMISGNTLRGGTYGISASNITNVYAGPNRISGAATATWTGLSNNDAWTRAATVVEDDDLLANASASAADNNAAIAKLLAELEAQGILITT